MQPKDEREVKDIAMPTLSATRNRVLWRAMITNVVNEQGTYRERERERDREREREH